MSERRTKSHRNPGSTGIVVIKFPLGRMSMWFVLSSLFNNDDIYALDQLNFTLSLLVKKTKKYSEAKNSTGQTGLLISS